MVNKEIKYGRRFSLKFSKLRISKILAGKIALLGLVDLESSPLLLFIHSPLFIFNNII
nr:MAG TPA: hypothetical protein [Caudoviricetes sp.]